MGLAFWLKRRLGSSPSQVDLVEPVGVCVATPDHAGLDTRFVPAPWSVSRLRSLFEALEHQPSRATDRAARLARFQLSRFWLSAPVDHLQSLYEGAIGDLQRLQLQGALVRQGLARDERRWRDQLVRRMQEPAHASATINLLLAVMPYAVPGTFRLAEPQSTLPSWLLGDYKVYCDSELTVPVGLLQPSDDQSSCLLPLADRRGHEAMAWFRDEAVVGRMQALIRAYEATPSDAELCEELAGLRRVLAQLWLDVEPLQQQALQQSAVGAVTRDLICSGFGSELLSDVDRTARQQLPEKASDFSRQEAPGQLIAALLFVPLEAVTIEGPEQLPDWCLDLLRNIAAQVAQH